MQQKHHLSESEQPQSRSARHQEVTSQCADELTMAAKEKGLLMFERQQQRTLELLQDTEKYQAQTTQVMEEIAIAERNKRMSSEERAIISETLREVCVYITSMTDDCKLTTPLSIIWVIITYKAS